MPIYLLWYVFYFVLNCVLSSALLGPSLDLQRIFYYKESVLKNWWKNCIFPLWVYVCVFFRAAVFGWLDSMILEVFSNL